jgi:hypothetical protein
MFVRLNGDRIVALSKDLVELPGRDQGALGVSQLITETAAQFDSPSVLVARR